MKEYKVSVWVRIIFVVISFVCIAAISGMWYALYRIPGIEVVVYFMAGFFSLLLLLLSMTMISAASTKVVITGHAISLSNFLSHREIPLEDVGVYWMQSSMVTLYSPNNKPIAIPFYIGGFEQISEWVISSFKNQSEERAAERIEILQNELYGNDEEERKRQILRARRTVMLLNGAGIFLMFFNFATFLFYPFLLVLNVIYPVLVLATYKRMNGLARIDSDDSSARPSLSTGIILPAINLFATTLVLYDMLVYDLIFIYTFIAGLIGSIITLVAVSRRDMSRDFFTIAFTILLTVMYGYGLTVFVNCCLDRSAPSHHSVVVSDKYSSKPYKHRNYYFVLDSGEPLLSRQKVKVSSGLYGHSHIGDTVMIDLRDGILGVSWYTVEDK